MGTKRQSKDSNKKWEIKSLSIDLKVYKQKHPEITSWQHSDLAELLTCKHDESEVRE